MKNNCCKLNSRTAYFCILIFFSGVLTVVLEYVLGHTRERPSASVGRKKEAIEEHATGKSSYVECLKLLKALSCGNAAVQEKVFDHLSQLLEIKVVDRVGMQILTSTIAEVFQQAGPEICLKVKEDQMRRILQLVFEGGEDGRAELVSTLHSIAKVF